LDKNIRAAFALDEGKTLAAVEPLDRADYTFAHFETPSGTKKIDMTGAGCLSYGRGFALVAT
jgi:hypothetical protein